MAHRFYLDQISLTGYKNYTHSNFLFTERVVGICGLNGKGKTNLLDAISYLCFTRSYFTRSDQINVNFDQDGFRIEGTLENVDGEREKIVCIYRPGGKKEIYLNEIQYEKFSQHIGKFPCVLIAPDDISLVTGGSEERRKFLDTLLSQLDEKYLHELIHYNKLLAQRNALLKYESQKYKRDEVLLQSIDEQIIPAAKYIFDRRKIFCKKIFPSIKRFYEDISGGAESLEMEYESQLHDNDFKILLQSSIEKDRLTQRTNAGIHKDDIIFKLESLLFRSIASQGQRKSLLFACRLAEFDVLKTEKGFPPLLLLDDIFEKLDERRIHNLLHFICLKNDGQIFITDTNEVRLKDAIAEFSLPIQVIQLD